MLAGCGGTKHPAALTTTTGPKLPSLHAAERKLYGKTFAEPLYNQRPWAVVQVGRGKAAKAVVFHYTGGKWIVDRSHVVRLGILGPKPGSTHAPITQVAMTMRSSRGAITKSGLWVDGFIVNGKVAGSPTDYTIYGANPVPLKKGLHVVVGFAGTAAHGSATAWTYRVG